MKKQIGKAYEAQEITNEYSTKPAKELKKMNDIDFTKVNFFPFQAQIKYTTLDGMKCIRLITKLQKITFEKEEAKKEMDHNIISINAIQQSAKIAQRGDFRSAQANMHNWKNMLKFKKSSTNFVNIAAPCYHELQHQQVANLGEVRERGMPIPTQKMNDSLVVESMNANRINTKKITLAENKYKKKT